jgi:hypothetical protein
MVTAYSIAITTRRRAARRHGNIVMAAMTVTA